MHLHHRRLGSLLALAVSITASGCPSGDRQVSSAIREQLPRLVGPAASYRVDVRGVSRSGASRAAATGTRIRIPTGPVLDRAEVRMTDISYDASSRQVTQVGAASATIRVLGPDLRTFLETQRALQNVALNLDAPDRATIQARPQIAGVNLPPGAVVSLSGQLRPAGPGVRYEVDQASVAGIALPAAVTRIITQTVNPLVDLRGMPMQLQVTGVRVENGAITVDATGRLIAPLAIP